MGQKIMVLQKPGSLVMVNTEVEKETSDFLDAIKTGHLGSIAGNPAQANMYKVIEALLQNCTTNIVFGETGEGKNFSDYEKLSITNKEFCQIISGTTGEGKTTILSDKDELQSERITGIEQVTEIEIKNRK